MIRGVHHIGLSVTDLSTTAVFYQQAAQFTPLPQHPFAVDKRFSSVCAEDRAISTSMMLKAPNGYLEIFGRDGANEPSRWDVNKSGLRHICVQSAKGPDVYQKFTAAGATFHSEFVSLGTGYLYAYGRDPEDNVVELEGAPRGPAGLSPWLAHVAIVTHDIDRLSAFYSEILQRPIHNQGHFHSNKRFDTVTALQDVDVKAAWIHTENLIIEMWQYINPSTEQRTSPPSFSDLGFNHISFEVDDVALEVDRLKQCGFEICRKEVSFAGGKSVLGRDIDGNLIEFLELDEHRAEYSIRSLEETHIFPLLSGVEVGAV